MSYVGRDIWNVIGCVVVSFVCGLAHGRMNCELLSRRGVIY